MRSATEEIPRMLWDPGVHYSVLVSLRARKIQSTPRPISLRSLLILPSHLCLGILCGSFIQIFLLIPYVQSSSLPYTPHTLSISYFLIHPSNNIWRRKQILKFHIMQPSSASSILGPNIPSQHPCSQSPNVRGQVSHPYKTTFPQIILNYVGFEAFMAMESYIFWDITPFSPLKVN
jgi:hypothetical protein